VASASAEHLLHLDVAEGCDSADQPFLLHRVHVTP
jgi:hypothetical protein